jgi:zinc and cadmium transporter
MHPILLESGYSKTRALILNMMSSLTTLPGAVIAYYYLNIMMEAVPYILALSAASFIYIAVADLVPSFHRQIGIKSALIQFVLVLAGIGTITIFQLAH